MNTEVDRVLTQEKDFSKWNFNNKIFQKICKIIGTPKVDLIASRLTNQIPVYIAWKPDPFSSQGTDSIQQLWSQKFLYGFLPFYFITRVLHKVMFDQTENVVLLTPTWHIQAWYSQLLLMLIDKTILLPKQRNILKDPSGKEHPLVIKNSMRLVGSKISGRSYLCHKFQKQLITGARRASFKANYESVWRKRIDWCSRTAYYGPINSSKIVVHPRVSELIKGVFKNKPPKPKHPMKCSTSFRFHERELVW